MRKPGDMITVCHEPIRQVGLTDEEISKIVDKYFAFGYPDGAYGVNGGVVKQATKAQLKKVVEWSNEDCDDHIHSHVKDNELQHSKIRRRECPLCWQALLREIQ